MGEIVLEGITKSYGHKTVIEEMHLQVRDNEFFVLFGPAGAGKTTLLKIIAGIEFPQYGTVKINGEQVNDLEPMYRNISMVFENYALYPHLSVYDNIASPMRSKLYKKDEAYIQEQVLNITKLMKIDHLLERKPNQLSNGQRQRVAIGRCLVRKPNVFLMDEPLAHLDAKLRHLMRSELKEMQSDFNTTTIYVTHDYMEAMALADRIAVINEGKIEQIGTADAMYNHPCNEFVARLFGEPEINIMSVSLKKVDGRLEIYGWNKYLLEVIENVQENVGDVIDIGVRGVDIKFTFKKPEEEGWIVGSVYTNEPIGNKVIMTVAVEGALLRVVASNNTKAEIDQEVYIRFNMEKAMYFDVSTKETIDLKVWKGGEISV